MKHLFTASDAILSRAIRGVTGDPCSHYAIEFSQLGIVLHSNLIGAHVDGRSKFLKDCRVVLSKEVPMSLEQELQIWEAMLPKWVGVEYDYGAFVYQSFWVLMNKLFDAEMPTVNAWDHRSALLCTELYDMAPDELTPVFPHLENLAMVRPYQLALAIGAEKE